MLHRILMTLAALCLLSTEAACMEHKQGGKNVEEVFTPASLASLAKAACEGDVEEVRALAARGVAVNGTGQQEITPLLWALSCKNARGVKALLEAGADPNQKADGGLTAVLAAVNYDPELLRLMLRHGGDPNAVYEDGRRTALHEALTRGVHTGDLTSLKVLLAAGADLNRVPAKGAPIAEAAITYGRPSIALLLLDHGYRHDLEGLARWLHGSLIDPASEEFRQRDMVISRLETLGVDYERIAKDVDARRAAQGMPPLTQH